MEEESSTFLRYAETTKINSTLFDHTGNGDTHYAVRLNGSESERIGLAKSLAVMTGDTVRSEVYAKYLDSPNSPRLQRGLMRKAILSLFDNNYLFFIFIKNNFPTGKRNMPPFCATPRRPRSTQRSSTIRVTGTPTMPSGSTGRKANASALPGPLP